MTATEFGLRDFNGGAYKLVEGFPKFHANRQGASAQEQYIIDESTFESYWPLEFISRAFRQPLRATQVISKSSNPWLFVWNDGLLSRLRDLPGTDKELRATRIQVDPLSPDLPADPFDADRDAPSGTYQTCYRVTIDYDTYHADFTHEVVGSGQFLSYDAHDARMSDNTVLDESWSKALSEVIPAQQLQVMKLRQVTEHTFRWPRLFAPCFVEINKQLGKINEEPFKLLHNAPKNTVLFNGYTANRIEQYGSNFGVEFDDDGDARGALEFPLYDFSLHFSQLMTEEDEEIYGWNFVYSPTHERFVYLTTGPDNNPAYQRYDFNDALSDFPGVRAFSDSIRR